MVLAVIAAADQRFGWRDGGIDSRARQRWAFITGVAHQPESAPAIPAADHPLTTNTTQTPISVDLEKHGIKESVGSGSPKPRAFPLRFPIAFARPVSGVLTRLTRREFFELKLQVELERVQARTIALGGYRWRDNYREADRLQRKLAELDGL
jgi:hypothetical protein